MANDSCRAMQSSGTTCTSQLIISMCRTKELPGTALPTTVLVSDSYSTQSTCYQYLVNSKELLVATAVEFSSEHFNPTVSLTVRHCLLDNLKPKISTTSLVVASRRLVLLVVPGSRLVLSSSSYQQQQVVDYYCSLIILAKYSTIIVPQLGVLQYTGTPEIQDDRKCKLMCLL